MSDTKSAIEKVKEAIHKFLSPEDILKFKEEIKVKLEDVPATTSATTETAKLASKEAKLKDGTVITYTGETLGVDSEVSTVTPEGVLPLADGEYNLEDGSTFTVTAGKVSALTPAQESSEELSKKTEMETEAKVKERVTKIVETFKSEMDTKFKAQDEKILALTKDKEAIELKLSKAVATSTKQEEILEILLSVPTTNPVKKPNTLLVNANNTDKMIKMAQKAQEEKAKLKTN